MSTADGDGSLTNAAWSKMSRTRRQKYKNTITIRQLRAAAYEAVWREKFKKEKETEAAIAKRKELQNRLSRRIVAMQMKRQKKRNVTR
jgi:hypothetical protein